MRIAISTRDKRGLDSKVSLHFGRCPYYVLVDVEGDEIKAVREMENPHHQYHQPGQVPAFIQSHNADVMLSGGMRNKAIRLFQQHGIETATCVNGTVRTTLKSYLAGELHGAAPCCESVEHSRKHQ
jgi:predicted Fe-Mo cluster-binding NifX family protein